MLKKNTINAKVCLLSIYLVFSIRLYLIYNHHFIIIAEGIVLENNNNMFYALKRITIFFLNTGIR